MRSTTLTLTLALAFFGCEAPWGGWERFDSPDGGEYLQVVRGRAASELWAADSMGGLQRHDGTRWVSVASPMPRQGARPSLQLIGEREAFLVSADAVWLFNGERFVRIATLSQPKAWFTRVWAASLTDLWLLVEGHHGYR